MGWFNGIGWEALKETVFPQCREALEQSPMAGQALRSPFPNGFMPNEGGWRKGAAQGMQRGWGHPMDGDRVRVGSSSSVGVREDEAAAMWPAAASAPRLNASQDTPEPALDPGIHCRQGQRDSLPCADAVPTGATKPGHSHHY